MNPGGEIGFFVCVILFLRLRSKLVRRMTDGYEPKQQNSGKLKPHNWFSVGSELGFLLLLLIKFQPNRN